MREDKVQPSAMFQQRAAPISVLMQVTIIKLSGSHTRETKSEGLGGKRDVSTQKSDRG